MEKRRRRDNDGDWIRINTDRPALTAEGQPECSQVLEKFEPTYFSLHLLLAVTSYNHYHR